MQGKGSASPAAGPTVRRGQEVTCSSSHAETHCNPTPGTAQGISWEHRTAYCWAAPPPPAAAATLPYWQSDCVRPVGQLPWMLALQVG